jgi:hypothetical protein
MPPKKLLAAVVLALAGLAGAVLESSLVHTDDGCALETHCNACLLGLRSPGVVTVTFSLPRAVAVVDRIAPARLPSWQDAAPKRIASRGPPLA